MVLPNVFKEAWPLKADAFSENERYIHNAFAVMLPNWSMNLHSVVFRLTTNDVQLQFVAVWLRLTLRTIFSTRDRLISVGRLT